MPSCKYQGVLFDGRRLRPAVQEAQRTICGSVQMAFLGVRLKVATTQGSTEDNGNSHLSRDSRHFPQISRKEIQDNGLTDKGEKREILKIGNGVNGVNHVNEGLFGDEREVVVIDDET